MTWQDFGKLVFEIEDADPGYMLLERAPISTDQKQRFLAAWVTFYNPGIAAKACQYSGSNFWTYLQQQYPTAKRASERRHFRGAAGRKALGRWQLMFPAPERMSQSMFGKDYFEVRAKAKSVPQIGDYFIWKLADVQERVFRLPCHFPREAAKFSPKVPQQGARMIEPYMEIADTYDLISKHLNKVLDKAPPRYDRPYNMQEAETVCCVYKQYRHHKWVPYSRTAKATRSLLATPSSVGDIMLEALHQKTGIQRKDMDQWQQNILTSL